MSVQTSGGSGADVFVCPLCGSEVTAVDAMTGSCRAQHHRVDLRVAQEVAALAADVDSARRALHDYEEVTRQARAYLQEREQALWSARQQAVQARRLAGEESRGRHRAVPTAVLLQSTGALMILAATVLAFAIAWTVLPGTGQTALMIGLVFMLGGITVGLRDRVPTTSTVLASLTVAVAAVVAVAMPTVAGFESRFYPAAGAIVVTALVAISGRLWHVSMWRHLTWAGVGVSVFLTAITAATEAPVSAPLPLATLLVAAGAVGLLRTSTSLAHSDDETASTAHWSGVGVAVVSLLMAALTLFTAGVTTPEPPRLLISTAIAAVAPVLALLFPKHRATALLPLAAAVDVLVAPATVSSVYAALVLPALLAVQIVAGLAWSGRRRSDLAVAMTAAIGAAVAVRLVLLVELAPSQVTWLWLDALGLGLVIGAGLVAVGRLVRLPVLAYLGAATAVTAWLLTYAFERLPQDIEYLTVPALAMIVGTQLAVRGRWWPLPAVVAGIMLAVPSYLVAIDAYAFEGRFAWASIWWAAAILAVSLALGWRRAPGRTLVATAAGLELTWFVSLWMYDGLGWELPEPYLLLVSGVVVMIVAAATSERLAHVWWAAPAAGATVLLMTTYAVALFTPPDEPGAWLRRTVVGAVLIAMTAVLVRRRRDSAMATGLPLLVLAAVAWTQWLIDSEYAHLLEAWTLPLAALATGAVWLVRRPLGLPRAVLAAPAALALGLSTLAVQATPAGISPMATTRSIVVQVCLWALVAATWTRPKWCAVLGSLAIAMTWHQLTTVASRGGATELELYTWTGAVAVGAATAIVLRIPHGQISTVLTVAPAATLVLVPTALLAWSGGDTSWRVWFTLLVAGAALVVAVRFGWAGLLLPALVALGSVVAPVLMRLVQDLPAYVPLTLVGTLLLFMGARLEWVRRKGHSLASWATHLR